MFTALVYLVLPAAQALAIHGWSKAPVATESLAGSYKVVDCKAAASGTAEITVANEVFRISSGEKILAEFGASTSDGYGHFSKVETNRTTGVYVVTTASAKGNTLTLTAKTQSVFSRGYGAVTETCVLEK